MFSNREKRGILYLLLLIPVVILCVDLIRERHTEVHSAIAEDGSETSDSTYLFDFDPNTATLRELRQLGLSREAAVSIIRYRSAGKVFRIKEDLCGCYNLTDSAYYTIEPYIVISQEYQYPNRQSKESREEGFKLREKRVLTPLSKFLLDTVSVEYLYSTGILSRRQAEVFVRWHEMSKMRDMRDLRECYVVSDSIADIMEQYVIFPSVEEKRGLVDINKADSAELRGVIGIGEKSVVAIINFREKLGGFYSCNQLSELEVVSESNFEKIIKQISCDSCDISKIDINFAVAKKLMEHPYISRKALRRLLKIRQIKGGWSNIVEMTEDDIFTQEEAEKLRPYLWFDSYTKLQE